MSSRERGRRGYSREREDRKRDSVSLFVRGLSSKTRTDDLRKAFEKFGDLKDVYIPKHYYSGEPRGFAYIQFVDQKSADIARAEMDGKLVDGRHVEVLFAQGDRKTPQQMRTRRRSASPQRGRGRRSYSRSRSPPRRRSRSPARKRRRSRTPSRSPRRRSPSPRRTRSRSPRRSPRHSASPRRTRSPSPKRQRSQSPQERNFDGKQINNNGENQAGSPSGNRSPQQDQQPQQQEGDVPQDIQNNEYPPQSPQQQQQE